MRTTNLALENGKSWYIFRLLTDIFRICFFYGKKDRFIWFYLPILVMLILNSKYFSYCIRKIWRYTILFFFIFSELLKSSEQIFRKGQSNLHSIIGKNSRYFNYIIIRYKAKSNVDNDSGVGNCLREAQLYLRYDRRFVCSKYARLDFRLFIMMGLNWYIEIIISLVFNVREDGWFLFWIDSVNMLQGVWVLGNILCERNINIINKAMSMITRFIS